MLLLPFIVPMLTVSVRRLHDTGKSGWAMFIVLIPFSRPHPLSRGHGTRQRPGRQPVRPLSQGRLARRRLSRSGA
ncbi:DUF805 domain-containing protein [Streptomyces caniscabiei]|uniref:DUF805 domain-containing protein n=1 Tax=Streptomyces caniscabiei TaxID=2746961 RepID=UPI003B983303